MKDILLNTSHAKTVRALLHFRQDSSFPHPDGDLNVNGEQRLLSSKKKKKKRRLKQKLSEEFMHYISDFVKSYDSFFVRNRPNFYLF